MPYQISPVSAQDALERLIRGNAQFVDELSHLGTDTAIGKDRRLELLSGQNPFAIVLGCSDSRVPAEIVFNQGLGGLFVIRVAGNIVAPSQIGSVEFAAERFGTRLVIVLGHSDCGAIAATLEQLVHPQEKRSPHLSAIVERIRPSMETLIHTDADLPHEELLHLATRANIRASANQLRHGSAILEELSTKGLKVVGAEYSLSTGKVDFFDGI